MVCLMTDELEDDEEPLDEGAEDDVSLRPNENADDWALVQRLVPAKIREKYEILSYRNAARTVLKRGRVNLKISLRHSKTSL